jgi:hypothetical protein
VEPEELADAIKRLTAWAETHAPEPEAEPRRRLADHFGSDPAELPIVTRPLQAWDRPNLQVAVDIFLADREHELLGLTTPQGYDIGLTELGRGGAWNRSHTTQILRSGDMPLAPRADQRRQWSRRASVQYQHPRRCSSGSSALCWSSSRSSPEPRSTWWTKPPPHGWPRLRGRQRGRRQSEA